uniref:Uncharacterized protein n=1 Tax=Anguilla anguilla TaxID=7936 RepID=A0A0E9TXZ0_ANGAN
MFFDLRIRIIFLQVLVRGLNERFEEQFVREVDSWKQTLRFHFKLR